MNTELRLFPPLEKGFSSFMLLMKKMKTKLRSYYYEVENEKEVHNTMSLLDLPDLTFECILDRLSPAGLCAMAGVCSSFRERCISDHLWEKHVKRKWGKVLGNAAYREWHIASTMRPKLLGPCNQNNFLGKIFPFSSLFNPKFEKTSNHHKKSDLPVYSIMSMYISLETGKYCFPAQVYNRENGHVGFMLSCYDAKLTYDFKTNTFQARYSPHGRGTTEENISWDRLRAPAIDTCSYDLHVSDSLHDLKPDDHIEIQWRISKEFPYGWWYGVVGHMESCDGSENNCRCRYSDRVMLEFKQFPRSSRWRKTEIKREDHREVGNESDGFYGGIRKLYKEEEISTWKRFSPKQILE